MGSYMGDISSIGSIGSGNQLPADLKVKSKSDSMGLDMTSFLKLTVAELTNQSIDQTADTSDMLNQMVQMQMAQALVNMTDASVMSYAVGTVTGTGTYNGSQVVFVGDKYYPLSEILAVGTLPPKVEKPEETKPGETPPKVDKPEGSETEGTKPDETEPEEPEL